jgi:hypothetical protein
MEEHAFSGSSCNCGRRVIPSIRLQQKQLTGCNFYRFIFHMYALCFSIPASSFFMVVERRWLGLEEWGGVIITYGPCHGLLYPSTIHTRRMYECRPIPVMAEDCHNGDIVRQNNNARAASITQNDVRWGSGHSEPSETVT